MRVLKGILGQLSFFTIIPVGKTDFESTVEYSFLAPLIVGVVTGSIDFLALFLAKPLIGNLSVLVLIPVVEILRGFNHLDGLLDFGDALMIRGNVEERRRALKDFSIGTGGIGIAIVYLIVFYIAVRTITRIGITTLLSLISAEVLSRSVGLLTLAIMKPMEGSNLGKMFHEKLRRKWPALIIQSLPFITPGTLILMPVLLATFTLLGKRVLGGSSGDLTGMTITLSFPLLLLGENKCLQFLFLRYF